MDAARGRRPWRLRPAVRPYVPAAVRASHKTTLNKRLQKPAV
jgi:hypothetical protein